MSILVTGGCGFIGSHFIRHLLRRHPDAIVLNLDNLTYAGNQANLADVEAEHGGQRYHFIQGDICDESLVDSIFQGSRIHHDSNPTDLRPHALVNFAAESHVDRSIRDSHPFIQTNIIGVQVLMEAARRYWEPHLSNIPREAHSRDKRVFLQISTDEVYGALGEEGHFTEESPILPNSPYAASKAAADLLVHSYYKTYGLPVIVVRSANNYGPHQYPEKFIPLMITNSLANKPLPIYGDGRNVRDWLYVEDNCDAITLALYSGKIGEVYNIPGTLELRNLDVVQRILELLGKPKSLITMVEDRLGHDWRYAMKGEKIRALGWAPRVMFEDGLKLTIRWYQEHAHHRAPAS